MLLQMCFCINPLHLARLDWIAGMHQAKSNPLQTSSAEGCLISFITLGQLFAHVPVDLLNRRLKSFAVGNYLIKINLASLYWNKRYL